MVQEGEEEDGPGGRGEKQEEEKQEGNRKKRKKDEETKADDEEELEEKIGREEESAGGGKFMVGNWKNRKEEVEQAEWDNHIRKEEPFLGKGAQLSKEIWLTLCHVMASDHYVTIT